MRKLLVVIQVKGSVTNQLAAAYEQKLITPGCSVHLTVNCPKDKNGWNSEEVTTTIKLQLIKEGTKKVDIDVGEMNCSFQEGKASNY